MGQCQLAHVPEGWPECVGKRVPHQSKRLECCKRVAVPLGAAKGVFALVTVHLDFRATRPLPGPARAMRPPHRFHSIHFLTRLCMHSGGLPLSPVAPKRAHRAQAARALVPKQGKTPAGEWIHEVDALSVCRCKLPWSSEGLLEKIALCFLTSAIRVTECECRCRRPAASTWIRNRSQVRVIRAPRVMPQGRATRTPSHTLGSLTDSLRRTGRNRSAPILLPVQTKHHAHQASQLESNRMAVGNRPFIDAWDESDRIAASIHVWAKGNRPREPWIRSAGRDPATLRIPPFPDFWRRVHRHRCRHSFPDPDWLRERPVRGLHCRIRVLALIPISAHCHFLFLPIPQKGSR